MHKNALQNQARDLRRGHEYCLATTDSLLIHEMSVYMSALQLNHVNVSMTMGSDSATDFEKTYENNSLAINNHNWEQN